MPSLVKTLIANSLPLHPESRIAAAKRHNRKVGIHVGTTHRDVLQQLLTAAAAADATATLAFFKKGGELRYMACAPIMPVDKTRAYFTVIDLEKTEQAKDDDPRYRRIRLDTIIGMQIHYHATE